MRNVLGAATFGALLLIAGVAAFAIADDSDAIQGAPDETLETASSQYRPLGFFDPALWPIFQTEQNCKAQYAAESTDDRLVVDFSFAGPGGIEYLQFGTPFVVRESGLYLGIRAQVVSATGEPLPNAFNPRFLDRGDETHQVPLNVRVGDWRFGRIDGPAAHWGGDDDGVRQYPLVLDSITMDRLRDGWKQDGRLTVFECRFFKKSEIEEMISLSTPKIGDGPTNIFAPSDRSETITLRFGRTDAFRDADVRYELRRQTNGVVFPPESITPDADGNVVLPRINRTGFESFVATPFVGDGPERRFGTSRKIALAVAPEPEALNRWCSASTHLNRRALDRLPRAGVGSFREDAIWRSVEKEKGKYEFPKYLDEYVDRAVELGLEPLLIIVYGNDLYDDGDFPRTDEAVAAYARYAAEVAKRYKGRCKSYEIWNEWTGACSMTPYAKNKNNTPENYVKLLAAASSAIRAVDPNATIVGGGGDHYVVHLDAIEKTLKLGAMKYCDAFSIHPYIYPTFPEKYGAVEKARKIVELMRENGCENPRLWLTELGCPTYRGLTSDQAIDFSSQELDRFSAETLVRCAILYRSIPEIERFVWYDLQNDGTDLEYNENNFGILHNAAFGNMPKAPWAAYAAFATISNDATIAPRADLSTENRLVYAIERPNRPTVLAAWAVSGEETLDLTGVGEVAEVRGLYGEELPRETRSLSTSVSYFFLK